MISDKAKKMGETLVAAKIITADQLNAAVTATTQKNSSLFVELLNAGHLTYKVFEKFITDQGGIRAAIIADRKVDPELLQKVGQATIISNFVFPIALKEVSGRSTLALGMVDPLNTSVVDQVEQKTGFRVLPILISRPDFNQAVQNHFAGQKVVIEKSEPEEEKIIVIRPGGYEEELAFETARAEQTRGKESRNIDLEEPSIDHNTQNRQAAFFFGSQDKIYREQILARLDLEPAENSAFKKEQYTREQLYTDLHDVPTTSLEKVYEQLSPNVKIQALTNALIKAGMFTKRDILVTAAVSYVFEEDKP